MSKALLDRIESLCETGQRFGLHVMVFQSISHALEPQQHSPSTGTGTFLGCGHILPASQEGGCWGFHSGLGGGFAFAHGLVLLFPRVHQGKHTAQELRLLAALR